MRCARAWARTGHAGVAGLLHCAALALVACGGAHPEQTAQAAGTCASCHLPEYQRAKNPPHAGVRPTACAVCHTQQAWRPSVFDHPYPLLGAHAKARCTACHVGQPPVYAGTSKRCVGCHRDDYDRSEYPGHDRFATTCDDCHSTTAWKPARKPREQLATQALAPPPPQAAPPAARGTTAASSPRASPRRRRARPRLRTLRPSVPGRPTPSAHRCRARLQHPKRAPRSPARSRPRPPRPCRSPCSRARFIPRAAFRSRAAPTRTSAAAPATTRAAPWGRATPTASSATNARSTTPFTRAFATIPRAPPRSTSA